jgi:predicted ATP-grasp superfamily ATP-dependent carboligase
MARQAGAEIIVPVSEAALFATLLERSALAPAVIPFPDLEVVRRIANKADVLAAAPAFGISVPRQVVLASSSAPLEKASALQYPVVLKPWRSVVNDGGACRKVGVTYVTSAADLRRQIAAVPDSAFPLLVQERIVGSGIGVFLLLWQGETYAAFAHRRIREKPPAGGVSVYCESVRLDPDLLERSRRLLTALGWEGVAMVEYKLDAATGTPFLMEINGRFWGSLQLAVDAGVDFPRLLVSLALGDRPEPIREYRVGVRNRWWWGDVDHLLARLRWNPTALALPPGAPGRLRTLLSFLRLWRPGDRNEILRWSDPAPFFRETKSWLAGR